METKTNVTSRSIIRSLAAGALFTMLFFYGIHVFGSWEVGSYRPDPETTSTVVIHNKCALFGSSHKLTPADGASTISDGIDGMKLGASFINFFDGHIAAMIVMSILLGAGIFGLLRMRRK
ncbi:MAG: hypothetical protein V4722_00205 [Bacteroidota bacterium]